MMINVSVLDNGGFLPEIILLTLCNNIGELFQYLPCRPVAPVAQRYPCNRLTRWDVSSIPANGIFLTKKLKTENKNAQRVEND